MQVSGEGSEWPPGWIIVMNLTPHRHIDFYPVLNLVALSQDRELDA